MMQKLNALISLAELKVERAQANFAKAEKEAMEAKKAIADAVRNVQTIASKMSEQKQNMRKRMANGATSASMLESYRYTNDKLNETIAKAREEIGKREAEYLEKQKLLTTRRTELSTARGLLQKRELLVNLVKDQNLSRMEASEEIESEEVASQFANIKRG